MSDPSDSSRGPLRVWTQMAGPELTESTPPKNAAMQNMEDGFAEKPPKPSFWTYADKALFGLCELLALLFGLPFGDDLYHDKPLSSIAVSHWAYLAIAIVFAVTGPMFPWIRELRWLPASATATLSKASLDARVWIYALLLLFTFTIGPETYQRATKPAAPTAPLFTQQQVDQKIAEEVARATTPLRDKAAQLQSTLNDMTRQWDDLKRQNDALRQAEAQPQPSTPPPPMPNSNSDSRALIEWQTQLNWGQSGDASGTTFPFLIFEGRNGRSAVQLKNAYIQSDVTGETHPLLIDVGPDGKIPPNEANPVPPEAPITLVAVFSPPLRIRDFIDRWRKIDFIAEYEDVRYMRTFGEDYILGMLRRFPDSGLGPRPTKRKDAQ